MSREFDAVLFDFGGVLSSSPTSMMRHRIADHGMSVEQFMPLALGPFDEDTDHPWHRAERGEIDLSQFIVDVEPLFRNAGFATAPSPPTGPELLSTITPAVEMVAVARDARQAGYATGIVSNMISDWAAWRTLIDADELVDVVIDSAEAGLRKPNHAIFQLALDRLGVAAERTLFLDDFRWNVAGAERAGLVGMLVEEPSAAATVVRDRLGLVE